MYWYGVWISIPVFLVSYYLFRRYQKSIQNMMMEVFVTFMIRVGTSIFTDKKPVRVEKPYACIPYKYHGVEYNIYVPFSRSSRRKMINSKIFLLKNGGEEEELVQQPGCCFLVTASMLGGQSIKIVNTDTGEEKIFGEDDIPVF